MSVRTNTLSPKLGEAAGESIDLPVVEHKETNETLEPCYENTNSLGIRICVVSDDP
jgi:hypothetical protein